MISETLVFPKCHLDGAVVPHRQTTLRAYPWNCTCHETMYSVSITNHSNLATPHSKLKSPLSSQFRSSKSSLHTVIWWIYINVFLVVFLRTNDALCVTEEKIIIFLQWLKPTVQDAAELSLRVRWYTTATIHASVSLDGRKSQSAHVTTDHYPSSTYWPRIFSR